MVSRCVDSFVNTDIFRVVTEEKDENGNTIKLPTNQTKVRLYNKDIDDDEKDRINFKIKKDRKR